MDGGGNEVGIVSPGPKRATPSPRAQIRNRGEFGEASEVAYGGLLQELEKSRRGSAGTWRQLWSDPPLLTSQRRKVELSS